MVNFLAFGSSCCLAKALFPASSLLRLNKNDILLTEFNLTFSQYKITAICLFVSFLLSLFKRFINKLKLDLIFSSVFHPTEPLRVFRPRQVEPVRAVVRRRREVHGLGRQRHRTGLPVPLTLHPGT